MDIDRIIKKNKEKRLSYVTNDDKVISKSPIKLNRLKNLLSRVLITIILVLGSVIYTNSSSNNKELFQKYVFENTLSFTKIKDLYQSFFGSVDIVKKDEAKEVFKAIEEVNRFYLYSTNMKI